MNRLSFAMPTTTTPLLPAVTKQHIIKNIIIAACCTLIFAVSSNTAVNANAMQSIEFHGIRPTDPGGRDGLRNPERGLRIEAYAAELPSLDKSRDAYLPAYHLRKQIAKQSNDNWWIQDAQRYEPFGLTLVQTYIYLDAFCNKPISKQKLRLIQDAFDHLRKRGLKTVLRFAYARDIGLPQASMPLIMQHLDQLAPIIKKNSDVIYVMQAGFISAWGEWHNQTETRKEIQAQCANMISKILEILPSDRSTQVRVPKFKRWILAEGKPQKFEILDAKTAHTDAYVARIGFNNDGFLANDSDGGTWPDSPFFASPGNPEYDYMTEESPYVPVDGELFWSDVGGKINGLKAAIGMRRHHYTSFSLSHSYSEREGKPYSIDEWMETPITIDQIRDAKLPVSDSYFKDASGEDVQRTQFEYIRDHLGYRIELQHAAFTSSAKPGEHISIEVNLINRGFSTLHNPRPIEFILISGDGKAVELGSTDADPRKWQPFEPGDVNFAPLTHKIKADMNIPNNVKPGQYQCALWIPDAAQSIRYDSRYAVRVANRDVPWWTDDDKHYGANILGVVEIINK